MTDWKALSHAYGAADDVPELFGRLGGDSDNNVWRDLWNCLCHQGTVYSASYAALRPLHEVAKGAAPSKRADSLMLIGAIIASDDPVGVDRRPLDLIEEILPSLQALAEESMEVGGLDRASFIYLLEAASAFEGYRFWGRHLNYLVDGEFPGSCPACGNELCIVIGDEGFFVTAYESGRGQGAGSRRGAIVPVQPADESGCCAWLHQTATKSGQPDVASSVRYVFGSADCPACGAPIMVEEAIGSVYGEQR